MARDIPAPAPGHPPQLGAPDPERRNSPLESASEEDFEPLREQVGDEGGGCYFNDVRSADGAPVLSGSTRLRCDRGIWVEVGSRRP